MLNISQFRLYDDVVSLLLLKKRMPYFIINGSQG